MAVACFICSDQSQGMLLEEADAWGFAKKK